VTSAVRHSSARTQTIKFKSQFGT